MKPSTIALLDQAEAAAEQADALLRTVAARTDSVLSYTPAFGPITTAIVARLLARKQLPLCTHLSYAAPSPATWLAYAPGKLRCIRCAIEPAQRIKGTAEDHRCDYCKRVVRPIRPVVIQLPPVVMERGHEARCVPPVSVQFGLCRRCWRTDREAAA